MKAKITRKAERMERWTRLVVLFFFRFRCCVVLIGSHRGSFAIGFVVVFFYRVFFLPTFFFGCPPHPTSSLRLRVDSKKKNQKKRAKDNEKKGGPDNGNAP